MSANGLLVALQGEGILILPTDLVSLCHVLCRDSVTDQRVEFP